jgi:hypothetical protein
MSAYWSMWPSSMALNQRSKNGSWKRKVARKTTPGAFQEVRAGDTDAPAAGSGRAGRCVGSSLEGEPSEELVPEACRGPTMAPERIGPLPAAP